MLGNLIFALLMTWGGLIILAQGIKAIRTRTLSWPEKPASGYHTVTGIVAISWGVIFIRIAVFAGVAAVILMTADA